MLRKTIHIKQDGFGLTYCGRPAYALQSVQGRDWEQATCKVCLQWAQVPYDA